MGSIKAKTHLEKLGFSEADKKKPTMIKFRLGSMRTLTLLLQNCNVQ